jgi:Leucine-rich repeat (LRR) protein
MGGVSAWLRDSRTVARAIGGAAVLLMVAGVAAPAAADDAVVFEDSDLAGCVADTLGLDSPADITATALLDLVDLTCNDLVIGSLVGLEGATNLESLDLYGSLYRAEGYATFAEQMDATHRIFEPLTGLPNLAYLDAGGSYYGYDFSLAPLATLPSLAFLSVSDVMSGDLTPVAAIEPLQFLVVEDAWPIGDVSPLAGMPNLVYLDLTDLRAGDLSALPTIPNLTFLALEYAHATTMPSFENHSSLLGLDLYSSSVSKLGSFAGSPLEFADISFTPVASAAAFEGATELTNLYADTTKIADLSPFAHATKLEELSLLNAKVTDVTPLAGATALAYLQLDSNGIRDVSPLGSLPALEQWSALNQSVTLPSFAACVPTPISAPIDRDGSAVAITPSRGIVAGGNALSPAAMGVRYSSSSSKDSFSVVQTANVTGTFSVCSWPAGYLPTVTMPTKLVAGTQAAVTFSGGIVPAASVATVTWTSPDDPTWYASEGFTREITDFSLGTPVTVGLTIAAPGMQTITQTAGPFTVHGVFNLAFDYLNPPVTGTDMFVPTWDVPNDAHATCTWTLSGTVVASGDSCEYHLPKSAAGKKLSTTVTVTKPYYDTLVYTIPMQTVLSQMVVDWIGRINEASGVWTVDVGAKLTGTAPTFVGVTPSSLTYQWTRNGAAIPGATGKTYTVTAADAGTKIGLDFTAKRSGYVTSTSSAIDVVKVRKALASKPGTTLISGTLLPGSKLTAKAGTWNPTPTSFAYQWYRNGTKISGATKSTYTTKSTDGGATFTVKVTGSKSGYTSSSRTSAPVKILKRLTATRTPTISGTPRVKSTLTAKAGTWGPATVALTYQWYRNGKAISGATKKAYTPGVKDAFASFTVKVTGKKSGYASVTRTSTAVTASGIAYSSCAALTADYPGGVAKSASVVDAVSGVPGSALLSTTFVSAKLYALNAARDGDKDGWACEPRVALGWSHTTGERLRPAGQGR